MKTQKEFLNNCQFPELAKKTLKQGGVAWADLVKYPQDYYTANTGAVYGMIYYSDTVKFAKKNIFLIQQALNEFENECGQLNKPTEDEIQYYNWLCWFAWENTMSDLINFLEN